jgi:hypothetical protein
MHKFIYNCNNNDEQHRADERKTMKNNKEKNEYENRTLLACCICLIYFLFTITEQAEHNFDCKFSFFFCYVKLGFFLQAIT